MSTKKFDPMEAALRQVEASARRSSEAKPWEQLVWRIAEALKCLPSSFVDENDHILKKAKALQAQADSLASAGGVEVEIDRLRDALEHIQKACVLSRTQSRRIRWIETRAHGALIGDDRLHRSIDLPKDGGPDTAEKLRRRMLQDRHTFRVAQGLAAGILSAALSKEREVADGLRVQLDEARRMQMEALEAVRSVMEDAYNRRTAVCCGQAQVECCGNFTEAWTADDMSIMDKLSPIEQALSKALTAHRESRGGK